MIYVDLLLANGEIVRVECPDAHEAELHDSINDAMRRRDWWSPHRFDGCTAQCFGVILSRVAMSQVIGTL
jgi:hypothetical protein